MIVPTLHMNGTSRKELIEQALKASHALRGAMDALAAMAPNGRDYYPQGNEALMQAGIEHRERIAKVNEVYAEIGRFA